MARNASSTMTTSATATIVEIDSHRRWEMLLRLIVVAALTCRRKERMGSTPAERGRDLEAHGVERGDQSGDKAEGEHQHDGQGHDVGRDGDPRDEVRGALAYEKGD